MSRQRRCAPSPLVGEVAPSVRHPTRRNLFRLCSNARDHHGAATPAELRILRQGPAAGLDGSAHLLLRVHVLRGLRREQTPQCVPELRWWFCPAANPAGQGVAAWTIGGEAVAVGQAGASVLQSRRYRRAFGAYSGYSARGSVSCLSVIPGRCDASNPESRDSGFIAARCPGMTSKSALA